MTEPLVIWFDDPKRVKELTGKSVRTLKRWQRDGLTIRTKRFESGKSRQYVLPDEFLAFLKLNSTTQEAE